MNSDEVRAVFDRQMRRETAGDGPGVRVEYTDGVVRQTGGDGDWNGVLWSELTEDGADAVIAAQVKHFGALGLEFEWKLYSHDTPHDLGARLAAAGFVPEPEEALMVAEVVEQPTEVRLPDGVRLLTVTDAEGVRLMGEAHDQAFDSDSAKLRHQVLTQLETDPEGIVVVVAMAGDRPVCAARIEFQEGTDFASLWGGGTAPEWRGKGIYKALVAHRAGIAAERGYRYLQVDASDDSRPILQRLGFTRLSTTTPYVHGA
ncbi:GNAT family N-acetyltransferase [Streptomyces sp. NBC_01465]|uniref:GNAT family N-acetyltransferase n=1 Tax=Streptomyces sp. NBC_01465 TaxID=2903878 RepID=UPI002E382249|nr:GNAT family N-acetyltransferase [Streptomyces sp. NBC_01465]